MIAGKDTPAEMADEFFNNGVKSVIIKCGSEGCYFRWNKEDEGCMIPCFKVDEVVDTTGAGDSFCSGFLAAYARGEEPKVCATIGNATGALCVMQKGATSGTRSYEDTIKFMEDKINACKS